MKLQPSSLIKNLFRNVVGQEIAKRKFEFFLDGYYATQLMPHFLIRGAKGMGKTTLAKALASGMVIFDEQGKPRMQEGKFIKREMHLIDGPQIKNLTQFVNGVLLKRVQGKDVTIFIDEAHAMPHDVQEALLTVLNPNRERRTTYSFDEYTLDFDFRHQTFVFATSEPQKVIDPLKDRLEPIEVEEYTLTQMEHIVQMGAENITFKDGVLTEIASVLRGNARQAQHMSQKIETALKGGSTFGRKEWEHLKSVMGIFPLGLNSMEIKILKTLADRPDGTSLTNLAARTGLTPDALRKDYEMYLHKHGLMHIQARGRSITAQGLDYLRGLLTTVPKNAPKSKHVVS